MCCFDFIIYYSKINEHLIAVNRGSTGSDLDLVNEQDDPLDRLVRDIRRSVRESRHTWALLPQAHCNIDQKIQLSTYDNEEKCWNGTHLSK